MNAVQLTPFISLTLITHHIMIVEISELVTFNWIKGKKKQLPQTKSRVSS